MGEILLIGVASLLRGYVTRNLRFMIFAEYNAAISNTARHLDLAMSGAARV